MALVAVSLKNSPNTYLKKKIEVCIDITTQNKALLKFKITLETSKESQNCI